MDISDYTRLKTDDCSSVVFTILTYVITNEPEKRMTIDEAIVLLSLKKGDIGQFDIVKVKHKSEHSTIQKVKIKDEHKIESGPKFYALKTITGKSKKQQGNEIKNLYDLRDCCGIVKLYSAFYNEQGQLCL